MSTEHRLREELCRTGKLLADKGLVSSNLGTISVVLDRLEGLFLTKPGPLNYLLARPADFVKVNWAGDPHPLKSEKTRPSLNWLVHLACYFVRLDINAVVHAHPRNVNTLTSQRNPAFANDGMFRFRLLTGEACWFAKLIEGTSEIPIVDDLDPESLAKAVAKAIQQANIVAIRNHGIMAVGKDLQEACAAALVAEEEASIILGIYTSGGRPNFLSPERVSREVNNMPPWFSPAYDRR